MIQILTNKNIGIAIIHDKNIFIQLLVEEFSRDLYNAGTDKKASAKLLSLRQKEDKNLYTYYCQTKSLLKGISVQDQITNNSGDTVTLSLSKQ